MSQNCSDQTDQGTEDPLVWVALGIIMVTLVLLIAYPFAVANRAAALENTAVFTEVDEVPTFDYRTPYSVALEKIRANTDPLSGEVATVSYVVNFPGGPRWTGLVTSPGFGAPQGVVEWDSQADTFNTCWFDDATSTAKENFTAPFRREVQAVYPSVNMLDTVDVYAACMTGNATIFWPFSVSESHDSTGTFWVPGGVATMGSSGNVTIDDDGAESGDYPGAVVSVNIVADILSVASDEDAGKSSAHAHDITDVNVGTDRKFMLATTNGDLRYVTLLSMVGSGRSTAAIAVTEVDRFEPSVRPVVTIYDLPDPLPTIAEVENRLRNQYPDMGQPNTGWDDGLHVLELIPMSSTTQAATLGVDAEIVTVAIVGRDSISIDYTYADNTPNSPAMTEPAETE